MVLTLITNGDGGAFLAAQNAHFYLILCLILRCGQNDLVSPNMRQDMLPWSIGGGDRLACECGIAQEGNKIRTNWCNSLGLPHTPMPQPSKQLLNVCLSPPLHDIVILLAGCQSAILSSNEWHNHMHAAFINTIMAPNFKIKQITSGTTSSIPIPN